MAQPVAFPEATAILRAPAGLEAEVAPLPVALVDGAYMSCWEFTPAEIAEVVATGRAWLGCRSVQPPVFVSGHKHDVLPDGG